MGTSWISVSSSFYVYVLKIIKKGLRIITASNWFTVYYIILVESICDGCPSNCFTWRCFTLFSMLSFAEKDFESLLIWLSQLSLLSISWPNDLATSVKSRVTSPHCPCWRRQINQFFRVIITVSLSLSELWVYLHCTNEWFLWIQRLIIDQHDLPQESPMTNAVVLSA